MLSLFTAFHVNLAFSAIPPGDVGRVLERCVWPLVEATRTPGIRLGIEMPADSLATIAREDPLLLAAVRDGIAESRLEVVGSGLVQTVAPLVPAELNHRNLVRGRAVYHRLLGATPRVGFVHEQTYSAGLVRIYRDAGYEALVAEWENPASAQGWPEHVRYRAATVEGTGGARIACLWNSSVLFQRVQRYAHGELELEELLTLLDTHRDDTPRALCLYGGDCEVFDYRPGEASIRYTSGTRGEWRRLDVLLRALAAREGTVLQLPSEVLALHPPSGPVLRLESAAAPVPTKKQAKYNLTRWGVCGRENARLNARCHALRRRLDLVGALGRIHPDAPRVPEGDVARLGDVLLRLWGSDLRTHATEDRVAAAAAAAGAVDAELERIITRLERGIARPALAPDELLLVNPHGASWSGAPWALDASWPPGVLRDGVRASANGHELPVQAEEIETHRDGSWRRAVIVLAPIVPPLGVLRVRLAPAPAPQGTSRAADRLETGAATITLASGRGATLRAMGFPRIVSGSLAGMVPQGTFTPIDLAADWYTGGLVLWDAHGSKHTDLEPVQVEPLAVPEACPIRIPVAARVAGAWGELWKTIWAYRDVPRVDVRYHLRLADQRPRSLRLGVLTLDPTAFEPSALRCTTVNGGYDSESFVLGDTRVAQHESVSPTVSARGCLGATEGWIDVGDAVKGVTMAWEPGAICPVPLLQHEPAGPRALTRVHLSLVESDDTAAPFLRGHTSLTVAYLGRGADMAAARAQALGAARGLHVVRPTTVEGSWST